MCCKVLCNCTTNSGDLGVSAESISSCRMRFHMQSKAICERTSITPTCLNRHFHAQSFCVCVAYRETTLSWLTTNNLKSEASLMQILHLCDPIGDEPGPLRIRRGKARQTLGHLQRRVRFSLLRSVVVNPKLIYRLRAIKGGDSHRFTEREPRGIQWLRNLPHPRL